jgi:hypothetical protein
MGEYSLPVELRQAVPSTGPSRAGSPQISASYRHLPALPGLGLFSSKVRTSLHSSAEEALGRGQLRLMQLLAPALVGRAKVFGNQLALHRDMTCDDMPFFDGPGTMYAPLGPETCLVRMPEVRCAAGCAMLCWELLIGVLWGSMLQLWTVLACMVAAARQAARMHGGCSAAGWPFMVRCDACPATCSPPVSACPSATAWAAW